MANVGYEKDYVDGRFPSQRASNAENVPIMACHGNIFCLAGLLWGKSTEQFHYYKSVKYKNRLHQMVQ